MTRRTMLIAGAVAGAVLVLWYLLLWGPHKADLAEAKERRETAESKRDELATRVGRLRAAQKDEPIKRAQVEALRTTIPDEPNLAAFILDTNDAAAKSGIDFISVAPSEPAPAVAAAGAVAAPSASVASTRPTAARPRTAASPLPAEIKLQLQIKGGYFQVLDFLNRVNEMSRLVVTDGLTINSDNEAKLTVGVTARMFVRAVPAGFGDVPALVTPAPAAPAATAPAATAPAGGPAPAATTTPPTATAAPAGAASTTTGARS
ncbi:MAG: type 4a pilus biogenesis protein PilO [Actinomycetota bacterium]